MGVAGSLSGRLASIRAMLFFSVLLLFKGWFAWIVIFRPGAALGGRAEGTAVCAGGVLPH